MYIKSPVTLNVIIKFDLETKKKRREGFFKKIVFHSICPSFEQSLRMKRSHLEKMSASSLCFYLMILKLGSKAIIHINESLIYFIWRNSKFKIILNLMVSEI